MQKLNEEPEISKQTYRRKVKLWMNNLAQNLPLIRPGHSIEALRGTCAGPCLIVGAGPSLTPEQLLMVKQRWQGHVIVPDRMLKPCLKAGIFPEAVMTVDASEIIKDFYVDKELDKLTTTRSLLEPYESQYIRYGLDNMGKFIFCVTTHPEVVRVCNPQATYWFNVYYDDPAGERSLTEAIYYLTGEKTIGPSYGQAGGEAFAIAEYMGHNKIVLIGIDLGYGPNVQPMETIYWKDFCKQERSKQDVLKKHYKYYQNPFGVKTLTDSVFDGYKDVWLKLVADNKNVTIYQCSPYTTLFGGRIICDSLENVLSKAEKGTL